MTKLVSDMATSNAFGINVSDWLMLNRDFSRYLQHRQSQKKIIDWLRKFAKIAKKTPFTHVFWKAI